MLLPAFEPLTGPPVDPRRTRWKICVAISHALLDDRSDEDVAADHVFVADEVSQFVAWKLVPERSHHRLALALMLVEKRVEIRQEFVSQLYVRAIDRRELITVFPGLFVSRPADRMRSEKRRQRRGLKPSCV